MWVHPHVDARAITADAGIGSTSVWAAVPLERARVPGVGRARRYDHEQTVARGRGRLGREEAGRRVLLYSADLCTAVVAAWDFRRVPVGERVATPTGYSRTSNSLTPRDE